MMGWPTFRYTYSTWANPTGESIKALQNQLGHVDSKITLGVYGQPIPERFEMARPERFELPTYSSGGCRSIQLSYGRVRTVYIAAACRSPQEVRGMGILLPLRNGL